MDRTYDITVEGIDLDAQMLPENLTVQNDDLARNAEMYGYGGNDTLTGGNGDDKLDGGEGVDSMEGGTGSDLYIVGDADDTVTEAAGNTGDVDEVESSKVRALLQPECLCSRGSIRS